MAAALEVEVVGRDSLPTTLSNSLTPKQKLFIKHYLELLVSGGEKRSYGTEAARLAGYQGNDVTLASVAYENLNKPQIRAELTRIFNPIADAQEVLARLTKYSRSSIADVLDGSGEFDIDFAKANHSDDIIKKLKIKRRIIPVKDGEPEIEITHELEIHDAKDATIQLAKVHKLLTDKVEIEDKTQQNGDSVQAYKVLAKQMRPHEPLPSDEEIKVLLTQAFKRAGVEDVKELNTIG